MSEAATLYIRVAVQGADAASSAIKALQEPFRAAAAAASNATTAFSRVGQAARELSTEMQSAARVSQLKEMFGIRAAEESRQKIQQLKEAFNELKRTGNLTSQELATAQASLRQQIQQLRSETTGWQTDMSALKTAVLQLAAALTMPTVSVKWAADFQEAMAGVHKTVSGTKEQIAQLGQEIRNMSHTIPMSAEQLAQIAATGGQLGISIDNMKEFVMLAAQLGTAFDMSAEEAATAVGKLMNVFNLNVAGARELADAINQLGNTTAARERDIINVLLRIGGVAQQFGLAKTEAAALADAMLALGKPPEVAATAINALLSRLQNARTETDDFKQALISMGLSANQLADDIKAHPQRALLSFLNTLAKLDAAARSQVLTKLFGREHADEIAILVTGLHAYNKALDQVSTSAKYAGAAQQEYEKRIQTFYAQLTMVWNIIRDIGMDIGNALLPSIQNALTYVKLFVDAISELTQQHPGIAALVVGFVSLAATIATLRGVFFVLSSAFGGLISQMLTLGGLLPAISNGLLTLVPSLNAVTGALTLMQNVILAVGAAWAAWQIFKVITALYELKRATDAQRAAEEQKADVDDRVKQKLAEISSQLGINIQSTQQLWDLQKQGIVIYDQATGKWQLAASATSELAKKSVEAAAGTQQLTDATSKATVLTKTYAEQHKLLSEALKTQLETVQSTYDLLAKSNSKGDNTSAFLQSIEAQRNAIQSFYDNATALANRYYGSVKGAEDQLLQARHSIYSETFSAYQKLVENLISEERRRRDAAEQIEQYIQSLRQSTSEWIRNLKRAEMSESDALYDREREIEEYIAKARQAAADSGYEAAKKYYELALEKTKEMATSVKDEKLAHDARNEAIDKAEQIVSELTTVSERAANAQRSSADAIREKYSEIQPILNVLKDRLDAIASQQIQLVVNTSDIARARSEIDSLNGITTHSTHIVHVKQVEEKSGGGLVGSVLAFARGGWVPGVGNKDTVPAVLQPGSFVMRKSAARRFRGWLSRLGNSVMQRFNRGGVPALLTPGEYIIPPDLVRRIGVQLLFWMNKYAMGGFIDFTGKLNMMTYDIFMSNGKAISPTLVEVLSRLGMIELMKYAGDFKDVWHSIVGKLGAIAWNRGRPGVDFTATALIRLYNEGLREADALINLLRVLKLLESNKPEDIITGIEQIKDLAGRFSEVPARVSEILSDAVSRLISIDPRWGDEAVKKLSGSGLLRFNTGGFVGRLPSDAFRFPPISMPIKLNVGGLTPTVPRQVVPSPVTVPQAQRPQVYITINSTASADVLAREIEMKLRSVGAF